MDRLRTAMTSVGLDATQQGWSMVYVRKQKAVLDGGRLLIQVTLKEPKGEARRQFEMECDEVPAKEKAAKLKLYEFLDLGGGNRALVDVPVPGSGRPTKELDKRGNPKKVAEVRVMSRFVVGEVRVLVDDYRYSDDLYDADDKTGLAAEYITLSETTSANVKDWTKKLAHALESPDEKPMLTLDRVDGAPGSPLRIVSSKGFQGPTKPGESPKRVRIYWDESILEDDVLVDAGGKIGLLPQRDDRRAPPWLWLFIPRNAAEGMHSIHAEQEETGLKTEPIKVRVNHPDRKQLAEDFDALLERYKKDVPANPDSTSGVTWNITRAFGAPDFKCGDYQNKVLYFLTGLLFNEDPALRKLLDGFDFGPLMSGPAEIRFTHHFVVIYPRGQDWHKLGVFLDPWGVQKPQALVVNPKLVSDLAWWQSCNLYQPEFIPRGLFIDRSTVAEFTSTPRADTLTAPGVHYPTHTDNPELFYRDFVHAKKEAGAAPSTGPEIPPTRLTVHCPVNVLVTDRKTGKRLGSADGTKPLLEIADGFCEVLESDGEKQWRFGLPAGDYDVKVTPYRAGEFQARLFHADEQEWREYASVPLAADQRADFRVEDGAAGTLTTTDGRDFTAIARKPDEPKEATEEPGALPRHSSLGWVIGIAAAVVLLLAAGVLVVRRRVRRA
jgi:hypothetical protein